LNYMNLMVVAGLFCGCIFFFLVWNKEKSTLSYNTYIILLSLLPMSVLLLFKLLTVIIKNIWFFIFISIISTLYVYAYLFLAIHIGIFAALVSNLWINNISFIFIYEVDGLKVQLYKILVQNCYLPLFCCWMVYSWIVEGSTVQPSKLLIQKWCTPTN